MITISEKLKEDVISSPVLSQFDPNKQTFLVTHLSAEFIGYSPMKPANDKESHQAEKVLIKNGECKLELTKEK